MRSIDVLLIEDDAYDVLITREALAKRLVHTALHVAVDGEQALDFLYHRHGFEDAPRPDLVLLDLSLPKYDGCHILRVMKNDPELQQIPVIVLATSSANEDVVRTCSLHANAFITKPDDLDQYMDVIRRINTFFGGFAQLPS